MNMPDSPLNERDEPVSEVSDSRIKRYQKFFMDVAKLTASNSFAQRTKVGAVLVKNGRIVASGWNGQPTGWDNTCEETIVDPVTGETCLRTLPTVIHAEANIVSFCARHGIETLGTDLYLTLSPCINCALLVIQAGIKAVYYDTQYRSDEGIKLLQKSGITVKQVKY